MDATKTIKAVTAVATLATTVACASGFVWSLATGQPALLPVSLGALTALLGLFVRNDYYYFFGNKQ